MRGRSTQQCSGIQHRAIVFVEKIPGECERAVIARCAKQN